MTSYCFDAAGWLKEFVNSETMLLPCEIELATSNKKCDCMFLGLLQGSGHPILANVLLSVPLNIMLV